MVVDFFGQGPSSSEVPGTGGCERIGEKKESDMTSHLFGCRFPVPAGRAVAALAVVLACTPFGAVAADRIVLGEMFTRTT